MSESVLQHFNLSPDAFKPTDGVAVAELYTGVWMSFEDDQYQYLMHVVDGDSKEKRVAILAEPHTGSNVEMFAAFAALSSLQASAEIETGTVLKYHREDKDHPSFTEPIRNVMILDPEQYVAA